MDPKAELKGPSKVPSGSNVRKDFFNIDVLRPWFGCLLIRHGPNRAASVRARIDRAGGSFLGREEFRAGPWAVSAVKGGSGGRFILRTLSVA